MSRIGSSTSPGGAAHTADGRTSQKKTRPPLFRIGRAGCCMVLRVLRLQRAATCSSYCYCKVLLQLLQLRTTTATANYNCNCNCELQLQLRTATANYKPQLPTASTNCDHKLRYDSAATARTAPATATHQQLQRLQLRTAPAPAYLHLRDCNVELHLLPATTTIHRAAPAARAGARDAVNRGT